MARIVKEADERKNEILDAAERLFTVKGYGKTTILDILEQVGIAKGTFYYYFKSKEEVMDAIIERFIEQDVQKARQIALDKGLTPVQKFCGIIAAQQPRTDGPKDRMIEEFHLPANAQMHEKALCAPSWRSHLSWARWCPRAWSSIYSPRNIPWKPYRYCWPPARYCLIPPCLHGRQRRWSKR